MYNDKHIEGKTSLRSLKTLKTSQPKKLETQHPE